MTHKNSSIVWFRHDLRLADNPALSAAVERERPVVCVFVWAPDEEGDWPPGAASRWWLHHSLASLDAHPIRLGLYFPLLRSFREWAFRAGSATDRG